MALAVNYDLVKGRHDLIAGLTVAAISFPQAMAYALIAGVDPRFGVYSAIVVTIVASIFGSSSHLINGPTSAISLLVFTALAFIDSENTTELFEALFLLAVLVGVFQIIISLFKLGNLTRYISESVIIGFMAAAAFLLAIGQLGNALGVRDKGNGHMQVLHRVWLTLFHGEHINYRALILSATAVVLAVVLRRLVQRYGLPQIDMLAVLVVTALIAYCAGWSIPGATGHTAVSVAAKIPRSLPAPHIPDVHFGWLPELSEGALAIAFVGIIEALSIAKAIAYQTQQKIDYNRQIMAEGLANLAGGFFQSLPGSGSLSRSAINFQSGAKTRFSGIVSAATVAAALLLFAPLLRYVPQPALAGLLLVTAARLVDFKRLVYTLKASRYDAGLVIVTAFTGVAIDLDKAVLLGVILSILLFVPRAAKLKAKELIVTPERVVRERLSDDYCRSVDRHLRPGRRAVLWSRNGIGPLSLRAQPADCERRGQVRGVATQTGTSPGRRVHRAHRALPPGGDGPRSDRPAGRRAPGYARRFEKRWTPELVPRRTRLPRRRRGIFRDAQGGASCPQPPGRGRCR